MAEAKETTDRYDQFKEQMSAALDEAVDNVGRALNGGLSAGDIA